MKKALTRTVGVLALALALAMIAGGCGSDKEDEVLQRQIQDQINTLSDQIKGMENHQQTMRDMVKQMRGQLDAMQSELDTEAPKIKNTQVLIGSLRDLTNNGFGPSAAEETVANPTWNVLWLLFFVLLLWILYRMRSRAQNKS